MDLVEDKAVIEAAYDDALRFTAAFDPNILNNVYRILGLGCDVRERRHIARYDEHGSRIEMYMEAKKAILVRLPEGPRTFRAGERIQTENSYKAVKALPRW